MPFGFRINLWTVSDKYRSVDAVIIGGGVIGLTVARALAQRGVRDVCVIDRTSLGTEASFAAGGILAPQAEANARDEFFELACRSRDLYPEFAAVLGEETGIDVELDSTGTLYVAFSGKISMRSRSGTSGNPKQDWLLKN